MWKYKVYIGKYFRNSFFKIFILLFKENVNFKTAGQANSDRQDVHSRPQQGKTTEKLRQELNLFAWPEP